jgi:hypothetical protein
MFERGMHFPHLDGSKVEDENKSQDLGRNGVSIGPLQNQW